MTMTENPQTSKTAPAPSAAGSFESRSPWSVFVSVFASMRMTVILLVLLGVLTWLGTLAQAWMGLFDVQKDYFESLYVIHDTQWPENSGYTVKLPLPGGGLLLALLFVNLLVGGVLRLKWRRRNVGVLIGHLGILLLLVASFVKLYFSHAGHVALFEGRQTATMVSFHDWELALVRHEGGQAFERTIPEAELAAAQHGTVIVDQPDLPFVLEISHWLDNCQPSLKGPMFEAEKPVVTDGSGPGVFLKPRPYAMERERNLAGCYARVRPRDGSPEQFAALWGADFRPWDETRYPMTVTVGEQTWGLDLRRVTWDLPFAVRLDKFQKSDHPGTMTPRDFSSWITVLEDGQPPRDVHIYMNHPLRKDGYVFFQTNWGPQPGSRSSGPPWYSVFEVARNPSDAWPKYASYVVGAGFLLHFLLKLYSYLNSSTWRRQLPEME